MPESHRSEIITDLSEAVSRAVRRLEIEARHAARESARALHHGERVAAEAIETVADETGALAEAVGEQARASLRSARREVRAHPFASIAIGAALGAAIGFLAAQRRR